MRWLQHPIGLAAASHSVHLPLCVLREGTFYLRLDAAGRQGQN